MSETLCGRIKLRLVADAIFSDRQLLRDSAEWPVVQLDGIPQPALRAGGLATPAGGPAIGTEAAAGPVYFAYEQQVLLRPGGRVEVDVEVGFSVALCLNVDARKAAMAGWTSLVSSTGGDLIAATAGTNTIVAVGSDDLGLEPLKPLATATDVNLNLELESERGPAPQLQQGWQILIVGFGPHGVRTLHRGDPVAAPVKVAHCKMADPPGRLEIAGIGSAAGGGVHVAAVVVYTGLLTEPQVDEVYRHSLCTGWLPSMPRISWLTGPALERFEALLQLIEAEQLETVDCAGLQLNDDDLIRLLDAVDRSPRATTVVVPGSPLLTSKGVLEGVVPFLDNALGAFKIEMAGCPNIGPDCEEALLAVFPFAADDDTPTVVGSLDLGGSGISQRTIDKLRRSPVEAELVTALSAAAERTRVVEAEIESYQEVADQADRFWSAFASDGVGSTDAGSGESRNGIGALATFLDSAVANGRLKLPVDAPLRTQVEKQARGSGGAKADSNRSSKGAKNGKKMGGKKGKGGPSRRVGESDEVYFARLAEWKEACVRRRGLLTASAEAKYGAQSGQIIAHYTEILRNTHSRMPEPEDAQTAVNVEVIGHEKLHFEHCPTSAVEPGAGARAVPNDDMRALEAAGKLTVDAKGKGYGKNALELRLTNLTGSPLTVVIPRGAIFMHTSWASKQNLLCFKRRTLRLSGGETNTFVVDAYCMNASCGCPSGEPMQLTNFKLADKAILADQCKVWSHLPG